MSSQKDGKHRADNRVCRLKSNKRIENLLETMNFMEKQREGPSGQHLADFATLPSAEVMAARA